MPQCPCATAVLTDGKKLKKNHTKKQCKLIGKVLSSNSYQGDTRWSYSPRCAQAQASLLPLWSTSGLWAVWQRQHSETGRGAMDSWHFSFPGHTGSTRASDGKSLCTVYWEAGHGRGDRETALMWNPCLQEELNTLFSRPLSDPATAHVFNSTQLTAGISVMKCEMSITITYFKVGLWQIAGAPYSCPTEHFKTHLLLLLLALSFGSWASPYAPSPCPQQLRQKMPQVLPSLSRTCF